MKASDYWSIFMDTGAPEAYLLYTKALRMEERHVPDHTGSGAALNGLQ